MGTFKAPLMYGLHEVRAAEAGLMAGAEELPGRHTWKARLIQASTTWTAASGTEAAAAFAIRWPFGQLPGMALVRLQRRNKQITQHGSNGDDVQGDQGQGTYQSVRPPDALAAQQQHGEQEQRLQRAQRDAQVDAAHPAARCPARYMRRHDLAARLPNGLQAQPLRELRPHTKAMSIDFMLQTTVHDDNELARNSRGKIEVIHGAAGGGASRSDGAQVEHQPEAADAEQEGAGLPEDVELHQDVHPAHTLGPGQSEHQRGEAEQEANA
jgi:hypothetical protein